MTATRLVIPAGFLSAAATLTPVEDEVLEPDETVIIDIDEVVNGTESGVQQVTVTILNDDTLPTLTINDATVTEGEAGPLQAVFTITLSAFSLVPVTVDYATVDGTAAAGSDYTARSGTLTYVPGQRVKEVRVPVADDALDEASEGFTLELSNATEAAIDDAVGAGTIHDDDPPPAVTLQVNDPTLTESQVPMATLTARLSAVSGRDVTVGVNFGGTATLGADYTRTDDRIVIPAGQISGALRFGAVQDDAAEGEETIVLTIGSLVNAVEEAPQEVTVTIADDDGP